MKYCKDCAYYTAPGRFCSAKCTHEATMWEDVVHGKLPKSCEHARAGGPCGPDAKLFEGKK